MKRAQDRRTRRPNIVFVISDDHCRDVMSCTGDPYIQTPNFDRLAQEGCLFSNSFTTSGVCSPARAAFLTGKHAYQCGAPQIIWKNNTFLLNERPFPALLHDAGYHACHIGKWHLGDGQKPKPGYDHWAGFEWLGQYFDTKVWINGHMQQFEGYSDDILSNLAADYIAERAGHDQPFCLYLGLKAPHLPFSYPPRHEHAFDGIEIPKPDSFDEDFCQTGKAPILEETVIKISTFRGGLPLFEHRWEKYIKSYYRAVMAVDDALGTVMGAIDEAGIAEDTILIYTSDQGYCLGHHGLTEKHFAYEQVMRIPLIVRYPRMVEAGSRRDELVLNIDVAPTLLDLGGAPIPEDTAGQSWRPLFEGETKPGTWREDFFFEYWDTRASLPAQIAVRLSNEEPYKLIKYQYYEWRELYDLGRDAGEMENVADLPRYAPVLADMEARLGRLIGEIGWKKRRDHAVKTCFVTDPIPGDDLERARALILKTGPEQNIKLDRVTYRWHRLTGSADGTFDLSRILDQGTTRRVFVAIPIQRTGDRDPHAILRLNPVSSAIAYLDGERIWTGDPQRGGLGHCNPPLLDSENMILLEIDLDAPYLLQLGINAPKGTVALA